jgi:hypothetical protein
MDIASIFGNDAISFSVGPNNTYLTRLDLIRRFIV